MGSRRSVGDGPKKAKVVRHWRVFASCPFLFVWETHSVNSIYDLVTTVIFAGVAVLYLQRSTEAEPRDHIIQYVPAALGCAIANYLGNHGQGLIAAALIAGVVAYVLYVLKPFNTAP